MGSKYGSGSVLNTLHAGNGPKLGGRHAASTHTYHLLDPEPGGGCDASYQLGTACYN